MYLWKKFKKKFAGTILHSHVSSIGALQKSKREIHRKSYEMESDELHKNWYYVHVIVNKIL